MEGGTKALNLIVYHFSLTFVNLSLKFLVWSGYYQFGIYQPSRVSSYLRAIERQLK